MVMTLIAWAGGWAVGVELFATASVVGLVLLGGMRLRGVAHRFSRPTDCTGKILVGILAASAAGLIHYRFVSHLGGYVIFGVAAIILAVGWYYANTATWSGWVVPLICCLLAFGGLGYISGDLAAPRRLGVTWSTEHLPIPADRPPNLCGNAFLRTVVTVTDLDTGAVWVGATNKDRLEYYEWYSNRGGCLGVLVGLIAGAVICRCRGPAPRKADPVRDLFLRDFPDEQAPLNITANSEQVRCLASDIAREPTRPFPSASENRSEA